MKRPSVDVPPMSNHPHHTRVSRWPPLLVMLLRKEVIQPHLPVRLPCYDLVPITDPTFDSSLTRMGHSRRMLPTIMTRRADCTRPGTVYTGALRICDYHRLRLHGVELQTPIRTETGFLGFAPPNSIATHCTGHCSMREAQDIRGMMI